MSSVFTSGFLQEEQDSMLGSGFKAERLRVNLRLVINRLKLLEKKKNGTGSESKEGDC